MKTVLIVEDEKMIRQGIKTMVQRSGVPVEVIIECNNGQMALDILKEQKIDVMFTDIRMPKMGGIELVKAMQECEHIPLTVAVSGYDDFSYAVEMLRYGAREYVLKPVDRDKIKEILVKLNDEIEQKQQKSVENRNISYQQLKYFILQENMSEEELTTMVNQVQKMFYEKPYVVYCKENGQKAEVGRNSLYICLEELEGNQIFIVEEEKKQLLLENQLKGSYVGESKSHQGVRDLKQAYLESREARKWAFSTGSSVAVYEEDIKKGKELVDSKQIHQIVQMIATDKIDEACLIFEKIVWNVKREQLSIDSFAENIRIMMDNIWSTYQNIVELNSEEMEQFKNVFGWSYLEELKTELIKWMRELHNKIYAEFDDYKNRHKIQKAMEYIQQNFEQDLNMAVVSNFISMNYSLFSFEFKQYTGSNFVTYLRDIRMNEAKRLLTETEFRIAEISRKVGYDNEKHFMKIFKSTCGVSPSEYRRNTQFQK